jgi:hypothetical protein
MKSNPEEKPIEKVEVKKPTTSIVKNLIKPIKVEKRLQDRLLSPNQQMIQYLSSNQKK